MRRLIGFCLLVGVMVLNLDCTKSDEDINVNEEILKALEEESIPSVMACIIKGNEIIWEGAYGYADRENEVLAHRNSLYTIMSIGKLVLSTAVFQLWEDGLIDLHADINQYLPFKVRNPNYPDISITSHMLLNHLSSLAWPEDHEGIPDFHHFYTLEDPPLISDWVPDYIMPDGKYYRSQVWKNNRPGERFVYSNIGTSLLALVVEQITGQDYRDYCHKNIFEPLEMDNTAFRFGRLDGTYLVKPYDDFGRPMAYYACRHYPAGFISTDIEDFSHFVIAMLNKGAYKGVKVIEETTFNKMLELQEPISGTANLWVHLLGNRYGHLGGGTGFSTWVEWNPDQNRALFLFSNKVNGSISPHGRIYQLVKYQAYKY